MANFAPMRDRFHHVLRDNLELFAVRGRFLDYGAGLANASRFLLERCGMSSGVAYDPAFAEDEARRAAEEVPQPGLTIADRLDAGMREFDLALLFDVIEHVPDAGEILREVHARVRPDGWLAAVVPYNAHEWGEDDEFYGHLRRLSRRGVIGLLERNGWNVIRVLDPTFPTFWLARRAYLLLRRVGGGSFGLEDQVPPSGTDMERSLRSPRHVAWNPTGVIPRLISTDLVPWDLMRCFDVYFESVYLGFELFVLCQKRDAVPTCEVCEVGTYSFHRFFDRYSLQKCGACGSEKVLPEDLNAPAPSAEAKEHPPLVERLLFALRRSRVAEVIACQPPERSCLDVSCGTGQLASALTRLGWRAAGTASSERAAAAARSGAVEVQVGDLADLPPDASYGVITLFHVIEHAPSLARTLEQVDRLLLPGGFLVLEYPNGRSLLKALLGWRWFGYDPPYHRLQVNPTFLADRLGLANYRLVRERHFSPEYSYFIFAQSLVNLLLPFQRDALYRVLRGRGTGSLQRIWAALSVPLFVLLLPLFLVYQLCASLLRRGCVVRQVFKKTDIVREGSRGLPAAVRAGST